jgi:hypothetical protein
VDVVDWLARGSQWPPRKGYDFLASFTLLLKQVVYLLVSCFECGGRIRSIQINGIKGGFHYSVDVAGVIRDWEQKRGFRVGGFFDESRDVDSFSCHLGLGNLRGLRHRRKDYTVTCHDLLGFR